MIILDVRKNFGANVALPLEALRPKKRLFLGLLLAAEFFVALTLYGAWRISYLGLENIFVYLPAIVGAFLIFISTFSFGAVCKHGLGD